MKTVLACSFKSGSEMAILHDMVLEYTMLLKCVQHQQLNPYDDVFFPKRLIIIAHILHIPDYSRYTKTLASLQYMTVNFS